MISEFQLRITPRDAFSEENIIAYLSREKGIDTKSVKALRILKKSIDARQRQVFVNLSVRVFINEEPDTLAYTETHYGDVSDRPTAVVVGAGPAGLFAALRLIEENIRPIVVERGKNVHDRKRDLALIKSRQMVDTESNYCFGEGGAGAYSDGKLYTRSKKRGNTDKILNIFCQFGASTAILADAHPHIGTDKLPQIIENMRNQIIKSGGEVHFQTKMTQLQMSGNKVVGIVAEKTHPNGEKSSCEFHGPVILATGHSARDVYRYLYNADIQLEAKGIAVGVRLEHPSHIIDQIQYHNSEGRGKYLPAAEYNFVTQVNGRGVYSFCMCPGGFIIPAATGHEQIVVNGMSPNSRGGQWSNSGMVVEIRPEDVTERVRHIMINKGLLSKSATFSEKEQTLAMMEYQAWLERECWLQGNQQQTAPTQRMMDFVNGKTTQQLPRTSYAPGNVISRLDKWMPREISTRLAEGFRYFGKQRRGFLTNEAVMIGVETRTSAPIRIIRNNETLQHVNVEGLFPCGEGAGYAGGIVSAGVDGERCAEKVAIYHNSDCE